jgi:hypothetical protein
MSSARSIHTLVYLSRNYWGSIFWSIILLPAILLIVKVPFSGLFISELKSQVILYLLYN